MAGWVKSLHCKSRAFDDVIHLPSPSCRSSYQSLSDVIHPPFPKPKPKPTAPSLPRCSSSVKPKPKPTAPSFPRRSSSVKPKPKPTHSQPINRVERSVSSPIKTLPIPVSVPVPEPKPFFPLVSEIQVGHPSRNVVEIIFRTRWSLKGFTGHIETVLKIQNTSHTVSCYEEYRDSVKSRVRCTDARCSADGNEMMRFRCMGPTSSTSAVFGATSDNACVCTYSGSGAAHESAGGGRGRRAMLVCRVIAGRVGSDDGKCGGSEFDSVSKENGELLVFDPRAVLPCFLVIYQL